MLSSLTSFGVAGRLLTGAVLAAGLFFASLGMTAPRPAAADPCCCGGTCQCTDCAKCCQNGVCTMQCGDCCGAGANCASCCK